MALRFVSTASALLMLVMLLQDRTVTGDRNNDRNRSRLSMMWSRGRGVGRGPVLLTHSPMHPDDIAKVIPMGMVVGAHVTPIDHMYFEPRDRNAGRFRYDVMAPADGFIVQVQHRIK